MTKIEYKFEDALSHLSLADPVLKQVASSLKPFQPSKRDPNFEGLVKIIINQQLSGAAARTIFGRLKDLVGGRLTPKKISKIDENLFHEAGISKAKTRYIKNLCNVFKENKNFIEETNLKDDEGALQQLIQIKGIGQWSARIFLLFYLGRSNIFALGDASIYKAIDYLYGDGFTSNEENIEALFKRWSPYNSIACMLLWRWIDQGMPAPKTKAPQVT